MKNSFFLKLCFLLLSVFLISCQSILVPKQNFGEIEIKIQDQELARLLKKNTKRPHLLKEAHKVMEVSEAKINYSVNLGNDLTLIKIKGKPETVVLKDPFKEQSYQVYQALEKEEAVLLPYQAYLVTMGVNYKILDSLKQNVLKEGYLEASDSFKYGGALGELGLAETKLPLETESYFKKQLSPKMLALILKEINNSEGIFLKDNEKWLLDLGFDPENKRAVKLAQKGDWDEAHLIWNSLLVLNPSYAPVLYNQGVFFEQRGTDEDLKTARILYKKAQLEGGRQFYREALSRVTARLIDLGIYVESEL